MDGYFRIFEERLDKLAAEIGVIKGLLAPQYAQKNSEDMLAHMAARKEELQKALDALNDKVAEVQKQLADAA